MGVRPSKRRFLEVVKAISFSYLERKHGTEYH